jgi:hypothetical protein
MPSIFGNAEHVLAWLGKDNGDAEEVSTLIHETTKSIQEQIKKLGGIKNVPEVHQTILSVTTLLHGHHLRKCFAGRGSPVAG